LVVYLICQFTPKNCGKIVFFECLLFLSFFHIKRMYENYMGWDLDVSTIIMINTAKWSSFAYNYQDG